MVNTCKPLFFRFIGEESSAEGHKITLTDDPTWIIDPIDGTMNFVHGYPNICISIGLLVNKVTEIGIIYNPVLEQLFTARRGQGAFYNDKPIHVSGKKGNLCSTSVSILLVSCIDILLVLVISGP